MRESAFARCHPAVSFLYFALVLTFSACLMHPLLLAVSLLGAAACARTVCGGGALRRAARYLVPTALFAAAVNVAFTHEGATILWYFPSGNPLTLESAAYGAAAAAMLAAVMLWFLCWSTVMSAEKLMYLLGRALPALALVLSMTLRFVPRFRAKLREVTETRRALGLCRTEGSALARLRDAGTAFGVVVAWSLEHAAETAESMRSRGYGLGARTAFSLYRLSRRDKRLLALFALGGAYIAVGWAAGGLAWRYYPTLRAAWTPYAWSIALVYAALCLAPIILERKEASAWSSAASNI